MTDRLIEDVLDRIADCREALAELALRLGNTYAPVGHERAVADEVKDWYDYEGIAANVVEIIPERANVVARLRGAANRTGLIFNAHLDTEASGPDYDHLMGTPDPNRVGGWRDGGRLFGHTILNDRGPMSLFMIAAKAINDAGVPLERDIVLTSVAGETGQAPVDEYQGIRYEGKGLGSDFLVRHGLRGDFALVAETTDFSLCWHNCGAIYYKVTLRGQNMYTPRLLRGDDIANHPNAIVKAARVIEAIERWAIDYEEEHAVQTPCGPLRLKAQVGAMRGGIPWRPNRSSPYAALYVDVRTAPGQSVESVTAALEAAIAATGIPATLDVTMAKPGALGVGVEPLVAAIQDAHVAIRGEQPPTEAPGAVVGMWRDTNVFNRAGIPSLTFGPSRGFADVQGHGFFELDDLVACAKMYALVGLRLAADLPTEAVREAASAISD
jgi:acetylornithine deacetylase/succinyl-diaminopimelate desuccinylase-like protein